MTDPAASHPTDPPDAHPRSPEAGTAVIGVLLVLLGAGFLVAQQFGFELIDIEWPFFIILPGVALLVAGLALPWGAGMLIGGSVVTAVGLVLLYQNATDHWESWAYAWALVGPAASGFGTALAGLRTGSGGMVRAGGTQVLIGLGLFAAGYLFFEGILNISGRQLPLPGWAIPAAAGCTPRRVCPAAA
ncbi:MAG TPA: hypothetical protein VJ794_00415, partial [Gemmatimonadales bacterium]|nr:hypothetical protein [Gemmatimonadales bacterium]